MGLLQSLAGGSDDPDKWAKNVGSAYLDSFAMRLPVAGGVISSLITNDTCAKGVDSNYPLFRCRFLCRFRCHHATLLRRVSIMWAPFLGVAMIHYAAAALLDYLNDISEMGIPPQK